MTQRGIWPWRPGRGLSHADMPPVWPAATGTRPLTDAQLLERAIEACFDAHSVLATQPAELAAGLEETIRQLLFRREQLVRGLGWGREWR